jgi:hypothetical protein
VNREKHLLLNTKGQLLSTGIWAGHDTSETAIRIMEKSLDQVK